MKPWAGDILDFVLFASKMTDFKGIKICTVKSVKPFVFENDGVEVGAMYGDNIYVHPLFLADNIELDVESLAEPQNFKSTTAYNSPNFQGIIEGTIPDFLLDFYNFYKEKELVYILKEGDLIVVYELSGNSFLVLQKVALDTYTEDNSDEEGNENGENKEGSNG